MIKKINELTNMILFVIFFEDKVGDKMKKILILTFITFCLTGCFNFGKNPVKNSTWIAKDGSKIVFENDEFKWYKNKGEHKNNYSYGEYEYYSGEDAIEYLTTDFVSYGITKDELEIIFASDDDYNRENFVVFVLDYDGYIFNGKDKEVEGKEEPYFGFILKENKYLELTDMVSGSYYQFEKN